MRILLIDDHALFREGLKFLLCDLADDLEFVEAGSCEAALACGEDVGIALLDLQLPETSGLDALQMIRENLPDTAVVVLSSDDRPEIARAAIEAGAAGFIPKSSSRNLLIAALQLVLAGGCYLPPHLLDASHASATSGRHRSSVQTPLDHLSERQREVLMGAVRGKPNKVIARDLDITEGTVKAHMSASFRALGVTNRTEAVYAVATLLPAP